MRPVPGWALSPESSKPTNAVHTIADTMYLRIRPSDSGLRAAPRDRGAARSSDLERAASIPLREGVSQAWNREVLLSDRAWDSEFRLELFIPMHCRRRERRQAYGDVFGALGAGGCCNGSTRPAL